MFKFCMSTDENFASFRDVETGRFVFIDSFDNEEFNVRLGTLTESEPLGVITADSDEALNEQLYELVAQHT